MTVSGQLCHSYVVRTSVVVAEGDLVWVVHGGLTMVGRGPWLRETLEMSLHVHYRVVRIVLELHPQIVRVDWCPWRRGCLCDEVLLVAGLLSHLVWYRMGLASHLV